MADIYNFITSTGTITTDAGAILESVANEYKNVFGQDLVVPDSLNVEGASTPQGLLIVTEALARIAVADNNVAVANQINPNLAGGIFLDAILALTGLQRTPASPSSVLCTLTGVEGTSIPAGSQASVDGTGSLFQLVTTTVIPQGGTISGVLFQSVEKGAIGCPAGDLTHIVSDVLGWETITNPAEAILGQATQSDVQARSMRLTTLASQGSSVAKAIMSNVMLVPNVKSLTFQENTAATTQIINGVSMVSHSIYACVDGGSDLAVAQALVSRKSAGASYNNTAPVILNGTTTTSNTTITMADTTGIVQGQYVSGAGIAAGSRVVSIIVNTSIVISIGATASATVPLTFSQGIAVSQAVTVPFSGQVQTVLFDRPTPVEILVAISVRIVTPLADPVNSIKQAILDYVAGNISGISGLVVGQAVSAFEIAGAVATVYPGVYVQQVFISISPTTPTSSTEIPMAVYEIASIVASDISVTIL